MDKKFTQDPNAQPPPKPGDFVTRKREWKFQVLYKTPTAPSLEIEIPPCRQALLIGTFKDKHGYAYGLLLTTSGQIGWYHITALIKIA